MTEAINAINADAKRAISILNGMNEIKRTIQTINVIPVQNAPLVVKLGTAKKFAGFETLVQFIALMVLP